MQYIFLFAFELAKFENLCQPNNALNLEAIDLPMRTLSSPKSFVHFLNQKKITQIENVLH